MNHCSVPYHVSLSQWLPAPYRTSCQEKGHYGKGSQFQKGHIPCLNCRLRATLVLMYQHRACDNLGVGGCLVGMRKWVRSLREVKEEDQQWNLEMEMSLGTPASGCR